MKEMDELTRAIGGNNIIDRLMLTNAAYLWLTREYKPDVLQKLEQIKAGLTEMFADQPVTIETYIDPLDEFDYGSGNGRVTVSGEEFVITDPGKLADLAATCDNAYFSATDSGTAGISFWLNNVTCTITED